VEDLIEIVVKAIGRGALGFFRFLVFLIWVSIEFTYEKISWWLGWPVVRLVTFGKYPSENFLNDEKAKPISLFFVGITGITYPIIIVYFLAQSIK